MRKIKSVKLKNDYRTAYYFLPQGTPLKFDNGGYWVSDLGHNYSGTEIRDCKTDLFEIEYESEKKYIDVRIEYDSFKNAFESEQNIYLSDVSRELRCSLNDLFNIKVKEIGRGIL